MSKREPKLWHRLGRRQVALLSSVAALDAALLLPLGFGCSARTASSWCWLRRLLIHHPDGTGIRF